ncbi:kinase-like domain-containing protein [Tricladium varicosporioides]|nr:kinase-like domain-containing protein [Hymenoscyphus varicosporioides]
MSDPQDGGRDERGVSSKKADLRLNRQEKPEESLITIRDIEEGKDAYRLGGFHPVYTGDVYNGRYEVLQKIGYGRYSTVWLVKDLTLEDGNEHQYKALKILSAECYDEEEPVYEREILTHLREADRTHPGYQSICHLMDDFEQKGPNGSHVCLVFELIGETLHTFRVWFKGQLLPNIIMRKFTSQLLMALDYAHDSGVIHTDIKPDNIFVKFRDRSLIAKFLKEVPVVQQERNSESYSPLPSRPLRKFYFVPGDPPIEFDVCLGDWGVSSWTTKHLCELIQPVALRSPEVLIGAPWDWTTDWWNLGPVILEVFRGVQMFTGKDSRDSPYILKTHLEEIVRFFGPFPTSLLDQGTQDIVREIFNEDGTIKDPEPSNCLELESDFYMGDLSLENRKEFVVFLHALMKIDPKERLPTMDLLNQPWIQGRR